MVEGSEGFQSEEGWVNSLRFKNYIGPTGKRPTVLCKTSGASGLQLLSSFQLSSLKRGSAQASGVQKPVSLRHETVLSPCLRIFGRLAGYWFQMSDVRIPGNHLKAVSYTMTETCHSSAQKARPKHSFSGFLFQRDLDSATTSQPLLQLL